MKQLRVVLFFYFLTLAAAFSQTTPPSSSNLPIIIINTNNQTIKDEPKITCDMGIVYKGTGVRNYLSDPFNHYNGKIAIEIRGNSSQWFAKKSYGFETRDVQGNNKDVSLLGMPLEHDWILSASYPDKTHLRHVLAFKLYRDFGRYAPRTHYCELVINGEYQGVYILTEKIKRHDYRVDIANLNPWENAGDSLTGGYILQIDRGGSGGIGWTSPFSPAASPDGQKVFFQYEDPNPGDISTQQKNYIRQYVDSFETALSGSNFNNPSKGYAKYCDVKSFIDYFILEELSANVDGYRLSTYLYKDKSSKGGKLTIGPPWDFDLAWLNADYCSGSSYTRWAYEFGNVCADDEQQIPFWWNRFMEDINFTVQLKCRWEELRGTVLNTSYINTYIDSNALYLTEGIGRNFIRWPILGEYVWPNPSPIPDTYPEEIDRLKQWIGSRIQWLDANLPGNCKLTPSGEDVAWDKTISVFPNPSNEQFQVSGLGFQVNVINIYDVFGKLVFSKTTNQQQETINLDAPNGMYILKISSGENSSLHKIIKAPR